MRVKPRIILFIALAITESIIMLLLSALSDYHINQWILVIFDASVVSLVAIGVINQFFKNGTLVLNQSEKSEFIAFKIGILVFTIEALLMFVLDLLNFNLNTWQSGLLDALVLSLLSVVFVCFIILRPAIGEVPSQQPGLTRFEPIMVNSILAYLCFAIILLLGLLASYQTELKQKRQEVEQQESIELKLAKVAFLDRLNNASRDLLVYSREFESLNSIDNSMDILQENYRNIIAIKEYYVQIRVLNLQGQEIIRVHHKGSKIEVSPKHQLQDKSDRYYFKEAIKLKVNQVFISRLDLNVEQGVVERPFKPMIRLATPIVNKADKKIGVMVINLQGDYLLSKLQEISETSNGKLMLLNNEGYWLFGGDDQTNWAFMFDDKLSFNFQREYPEIWKKIKPMHTGKIESDLTSVILQHIEFSPESITEKFSEKVSVQGDARHWPVWKFVSLITPKQISAKLIQTQISLTVLYFCILLLAAFGTILLANAMMTSRKYQAEVQRFAFHDHLTGLCNLRLFTVKMAQELTRSRRESNGLALMYFDLDYFKLINDELGHEAGDEALKEAAVRLKNSLRESDIIARIGGDEFAALLLEPGDVQDIMVLAKRIVASFEQPFELLGHRRHLGISIGIAILTDNTESNISLTQRADHAMYEAKRAGRNCFKFSP